MTQTKHAKGMTMSCLTVSDLNQAKHLLVDLLGLELKEFHEQFNWMELEGEEGARIGIGQYSEGPHDQDLKPGNNAVVSIEVANIEDTKKHLEAHGVEFLGDIMEVPGEVKLVLFRDQDGNRYFLAQ